MTDEEHDALAPIRARTWTFGDKISTDLMMPGSRVLAGDLQGRPAHHWCFEAIRPGWAEQVRQGDVIVAGRNFGCGSGRDPSPLLRTLGIAAVVADSFARSFFRNAINSALPVLICPGVRAVFHDGDLLFADLETGLVRNETRGMELRGEALPAESPPMQILRAGGFEPFIRAKLLSRGQGLKTDPGRQPEAV